MYVNDAASGGFFMMNYFAVVSFVICTFSHQFSEKLSLKAHPVCQLLINLQSFSTEVTWCVNYFKNQTGIGLRTCRLCEIFSLPF